MARRLASRMNRSSRLAWSIIEALEDRRLLAGGGFTNAGLNGEYFDNTNLSGSPMFTRKDVRVDFDWGVTMKPGGSFTPGFGEIDTDNYSVRWTGQVIPRFSETYTFKTYSDDGVRLYIKPAGAGTWTTLVDHWDAHNPDDDVATYAMTAGNAYDIKLEYWEQGGGAVIRLLWSSPSTPEEVIDPLLQAGTNNPDFTSGFTDIVTGARNSWQGAGKDTTNGWPTGDGEYYFQESLLQGLGIDPLMRGKITYSFKGKASVSLFGNVKDNTLTQPVYDPVTDTWSGSFITEDKGINASAFRFFDTDRNNSGPIDHDGITDFKLMRPIAPNNETTSFARDTLFTPQLREAMGHFTMIRYQLVANQEVEWGDRTRPEYFNQQWAGGKITTPHFGVGAARANGTSWEHKILLANETGRDVMFSIPVGANDTYILNLARMIRFGANSDGNPYTSATTDPVYPPLNPNLRVYLELGNELWNQASPFDVDYGNLAKLVEMDQTQNPAKFQALNFDNKTMNEWRPRKAVQKMIDVSNTFRGVFTDDSMPLTSTNPRIRPLYEWMFQSGGEALTWAERWYNNGDGASHVTTPHPLSYFLWGGGGATYYYADNPNGLTSILTDNSFENKAVGDGYNLRPTETQFTFTGESGIARDSGPNDDIPDPLLGDQAGYITDRATISFSFTVPSNPTSNVFAVAFKAVNRTRAGVTDTQTLRVLLDGVDITPMTQRSFPYRTYKPDGYDAAHPWTAQMVSGQHSDYFYTVSSNLSASSTHTITIEGLSTSGSHTTFVDDVRITSVDALFSDDVPGGLTQGEPIQSIMIKEANWAKAFGLEEVSYEGGWALGGDGGASYIQQQAKYGDSRTYDAQKDFIDWFDAAGSAINVYGTYSQWAEWSCHYATPDWHTNLPAIGSYPIMQAIDNRAGRLGVEASNGIAIPGTLTPANQNLAEGANGGQITAGGGWINWMVNVPSTGTYNLVLSTGTGGTAVLLVDNVEVARGASGGNLSGSIALTKGSHSVRVRANSSTGFAVTQISVASEATAEMIVNADHGTLIRNNGSLYQPEGSPAVGAFDGFNANGGYSFQLPTIPEGQRIVSILFRSGPSATYQPNLVANLPGDVYGLRISTSTNLSTSDYGSGTNQPGYKLSNGWFTGTVGAMADVDITNWVMGTGYTAGRFVHLRTGTTASESTITSLQARWWTSIGNATLVITTAPGAMVNAHHGTLVKNNGTVLHNEGSPAVGSFGDFNANGGYSFALPTIPSGHQISRIMFYSGSSDSYNVQSTLAQLPGEVYGLRVSTSANLLTTDYGSGTSQPGTKLTTGWFTGTIGPMAGVDITNWVMSSGYVAGQYVLMRTGTSASEATITSLGARWWTSSSNARLVVETEPMGAYGIFTADGDIGSPGQTGSASFDSGTGAYSVSGSGQDIWDYSDQFNYLYRTEAGDSVIVARVASMQAADGWAKSGIMYRESAAANSLFAAVYVTPENGVAFQWRDTGNERAEGVRVAGIAAPQWLKLVRSGNAFSAFYGSDGINWTQVGTTQAIQMQTEILVGLAVTAHNNSLLNTSTFTNVLIM